MFDHISKQREKGWKYDTQRSIFDEFRGFWKAVADLGQGTALPPAPGLFWGKKKKRLMEEEPAAQIK